MKAMILSHGHDTNGGNARLVEAAKKYGEDPDILKIVALGKTDPAGVVLRFQEAAAKYGGLSIRSANRSVPWMGFDPDIHWTRKTDVEVKTLVEQADVLHLNNSYRPAQRFFALRKPTLLHHHGSLFRNDPAHMLDLAKAKRWLQAVSTVDLQRPAPSILHWLPTAYDVAALQAFGKKHHRKPDGLVRIVHTPTDPLLKHTAVFLEAVRQLQSEGLPIDLVVNPRAEGKLEGWTHERTMEEKAQADIVYDQLTWGYGCNSIEAWGMGIPVVSGADEWTTARMRSLWGTLPFYEASEATLKDAIRRLVESPELRAEYGAIGLAHVRKHHDEKPALARLAELYVQTIEHFGAKPRIPGKGVTFLRHKAGQAITFNDERIDLPVGQPVEITDPLVVNRLRSLSKRTAFGIEEVA